MYRAEHRTPNLARRQGPVVLKTLHPHLARRAEFRERFEQEADICAAIEHPGVVHFIDLILENDSVALVLALVPGIPLDQQLDLYREDPTRILELLSPLAQTLDHLHTLEPKPIVHRDLKPSNILVTPEGKPVLIDFGIARAGTSTLTRTATAMGTPDYMAPEQELDAKRVDGRADVYALGVIAFRLLTGSLPWESGLSWSALFIRKDRGQLTLAPSNEAVHVFEVGLAPDPDDRFRTATAFITALRSALLDDRPPAPEPTPTPATTPKPSERPPQSEPSLASALKPPASERSAVITFKETGRAWLEEWGERPRCPCCDHAAHEQSTTGFLDIRHDWVRLEGPKTITIPRPWGTGGESDRYCTQCRAPLNAIRRDGDQWALCPRCGKLREASDAHCSDCGESLVKTAPMTPCAGCGLRLMMDDDFCTGCGHKRARGG